MLAVFLHAYAPHQVPKDQVWQTAREYAARAKQAAASAHQDMEARSLRAMALLRESRTRIAHTQITLEATLVTIAALQAVEAVITQPVWRGRRHP
jgi:hypothetical protein